MRTLLLVVFFVVIPALASANDSAFGGRGVDLSPMRETRVRMVSEDIVLERRDEGWRVEAHYVFANPTEDPVSLQMGFPEAHCDHQDGDCFGQGGRFRELRTTVRGQPITERDGQVAPRGEWGETLGRVYLYDVTFAPHELVEIVHTYVYDRSPNVMGETVYYLTRTGANWNGPIERARFTIRVPERPWLVQYPREFRLVGVTETLVGPGRSKTEIVFEQTNWTPHGDLTVELEAMHWVLDRLGCPSSPSWPETSDEDASVAMRGVPTDTLRECANAPYAAHGRPFHKRSLSRRFYHATFRTEPGMRSLAMRESATFDAGMLTYRENLYVTRLRAELARRGARD